MALADDYTSGIIPLSFTDADGTIVDAPQKFYRYDDGHVFWELRRVILPTHLRQKKHFRLNQFIGDQKLIWESYFDALGCDQWNGLVPSMKAAKWWGPAWLTCKYVRQEFTIGTKALFGLLVYHVVCSKISAERARWTKMLQLFLDMCGVTYANARAHVVMALHNHQEDCVLVVDQLNPTCQHNAAIKDGLPVDISEDTFIDLADTFNYMYPTPYV